MQYNTTHSLNSLWNIAIFLVWIYTSISSIPHSRFQQPGLASPTRMIHCTNYSLSMFPQVQKSDRSEHFFLGKPHIQNIQKSRVFPWKHRSFQHLNIQKFMAFDLFLYVFTSQVPICQDMRCIDHLYKIHIPGDGEIRWIILRCFSRSAGNSEVSLIINW